MIVDDASIIEEEYSQESYYDSHTQIMMQGSRKGSSQNKSDTVSAIDNFEPWIINILYEILLLLVQVSLSRKRSCWTWLLLFFINIFLGWDHLIDTCQYFDFHSPTYWYLFIHDMMLCHLKWGMYAFILFSNDNCLRIRLQDKIAISYLVLLSKFQDELFFNCIKKNFYHLFHKEIFKKLVFFRSFKIFLDNGSFTLFSQFLTLIWQSIPLYRLKKRRNLFGHLHSAACFILSVIEERSREIAYKDLT